MNRSLGIVIFVIGAIVLMYGLDSSASFASSVSKFFSGAPTNKSITLLSIGGVLMVYGFLSLFGSSGNSTKW